MKGKWSPGKITALVLGAAAAGMVLLAAFWIETAQLLNGMRLLKLVRDRAEYEQSQSSKRDQEDGNDGFRGYDEAEPFEELPGEPYEKELLPEDSDYYEFHDVIRQDLSYGVEFDSYSDVLGTDNVILSVEYPVVFGEGGEDMDGVNRAIQREVEELKEYVESASAEIDPETSFFFEAESYVTYMDEDILSIAYVEYGYLNGEFYESYVVSVNIDMKSKMALTNSQLLEINDQFSVDFRNRSQEQNGEISYLYNFTDQEITELLTDEDSLIIFYTPLGMEVGFNYYYGYGWVTVTYRDYKEYERHF